MTTFFIGLRGIWDPFGWAPRKTGRQPTGVAGYGIAAEFECSAQTVRKWVAQANADTAKRDNVLISAERRRHELGRLLPSQLQLGTWMGTHNLTWSKSKPTIAYKPLII
jgi:hypothetical protein